MNRTLLEELVKYFSEKQSPKISELYLQAQLEKELTFFHVTSVCRDDLESAGFDGSKATDADMRTLAVKLADDYCEQLFWSSLSVLAEECLHIPRNKNSTCPYCNADRIEYDAIDNTYSCMQCQQKWADIFVLVEFPEDASHFEQEGIGYPCFHSEDNGACYVPEYDYIRHFRKSTRKEKYFRAVPWPDSQEYMDNPSCEAIMADEKALKEFGSSSYWVPLMAYQNKNNNNP